ncbi:AB hydrolase superfamily protein B1A11.02 [Trametes pubescens]|uniref:AB hydrolase superfamily protein B1A11.02 n=1 Tax=Trametes pubescens TaxID=154538 RepID=A0A1M2VTQ4_TRAPU|nr:AB hydrolase superfamily protein B1A11.02 [Trametes pubescens]
MANNHLATPNAELAPILAVLPPAAASLLPDIDAARRWFAEGPAAMARSGQESHLPPDTAYVSKDHKIAVEGGEITVRSFVPTSSKDDVRFPLLVWTHGGGWVVGDLELDDYYLKALCAELQIVIINVDYRLAPEYPFPTGLNDSYTALKWAQQNADNFNADLSKGFLVGGASAGGNLAAVLAHRAKADPEFAQSPLTGQVLQYPVTVHPDVVPEEYKKNYTAYGQMTDGNILPARHMYEYFQLLGGSPSDPEISPLLQPSFNGLPPALVQVCGMDPLRDDGLFYADKLKKAGVPTRLHVYPGAPHGFHLGLPQTTIAQRFEAELKAALRWMLTGASSDQQLG